MEQQKTERLVLDNVLKRVLEGRAKSDDFDRLNLALELRELFRFMNILSSGGYSAFQTDVINRLSKEQMNDIYLSLSMFIVSYINILKKLEDGLSISPEGKDLIKEEPVPKETKVEKKKSLLEAWVV